MLKTKCSYKSFLCGDKKVEEFINEHLDKYDVIDVKQSSYSNNGTSCIDIIIIYNEEVFDSSEKELLKKIIKLEHISINNVQSKLNIGFNRASYLIKILEINNIISNKEDGRKLLLDNDNANCIIDSLK